MCNQRYNAFSAFHTPLTLNLTHATPNCVSSFKCRPQPQISLAPPRVRMSLSPDDQPEKSQDPMNTFNMEVLRRRMTRLDERQKLGKFPTDDPLDRTRPDEDKNPEEFPETELLAEEFSKLGVVWVIIFTSTADGSEGVYSLSIADENIVLAFQDKEEAQRYSFCLEAQKFPVPQVCELGTLELRDFCSEAGFRLGFVPKGSLISPPDESAVEDLDKWRGSADNSSSAGMSADDIETMKRRLDSLFGQ